MEKKRKKWLWLFICILSLNIAGSIQKSHNTTAGRKVFKISRHVLYFLNSIRFSNEQLKLEGNQEVFIKIPPSEAFDFSAGAKLSKGALLYLFFHVSKEVNREGYAFRISALPGTPTAFLKFINAHVTLQKTSSLSPKVLARKGWMKIRILSRGHMHTLFVDGKKIVSVRDRQYTAGNVSIGSGMNAFTVDNLHIQSGAWIYEDDFSVAGKNNKHYRPLQKIKLFLFIFAVILLFYSLLRRVMDMTDEERKTYTEHLKLQTLFLVPGAVLHAHDALCFAGTFIAMLLFLTHTFKLFAKTNTLFAPPDAQELHVTQKTRNRIFLFSSLLFLMLTSLYAFLHIESRITCLLSSCPKKLLVEQKTLSFQRTPYFLADSLNIRNPAISFDIYGKEGSSILVAFNKTYKEITPGEEPDYEPRDNQYAILLSFHKTLPTMLMKGQNILESAKSIPFLKNRWNHVEIMASGQNIRFTVNNKNILTYGSRKLFSGGIKIIPVYEIQKIKNLHIYRLTFEPYPSLFAAIDTLFFSLRLALFLFLFHLLCFYLLYAKKMPLPFYMKRAFALSFSPFLLWTISEILCHNTSSGDSKTLAWLLQIAGTLFMVSSFFFLHYFLRKKENEFSFKIKLQILALTLVFFEWLCLSLSPYMNTMRKPFYAFVHDKNHFWYFDTQVHILNEYFYLNQARSLNYPYRKNTKKRIAVFGSSSAFGQFFPDLSSLVYSAQLEQKLKQRGISADVLNFAIQGSTSFTGFVFLRGIYPLFKPDIILWNYAGNDMIFMRGTFQNYNFLESLYTQKRFLLHRIFYASYSFHAMANIMDSTWMKTLLFFPRLKYKRMLYEKNLKVLADFCRKSNIQLVLVHESSDEAIWFRYDAAKKRFLDRQGKWSYDVLHSFAEKHRIPYLFTVPELAKHREDRLYLDNVHYSKAGHDVMADMLYDFLITKKLIE